MLQRACACGQHSAASGTCRGCAKEKEALQRSALYREPLQGNAAAPPVVHDVLRASGQPLDSATRAFMEPRFGHDFSHVRVHLDSRAEKSAEAVNALAYTV